MCFFLKETPLPADVPPPGGYYVNLPDNGSLNAQPVAYQPSPTFWNQQPVTYYQNTQPPPNTLPPPPHRFSFPIAGQPGKSVFNNIERYKGREAQ